VGPGRQGLALNVRIARNKNEGVKKRLQLTKSNIDFETPMEFQLTLSTDAAIEMLSKSISTPYTFWFSMHHMKGPIYEGIINDKRFKIWSKMIRWGPPFVILTGEVVPLNKGSKIEASISAARWVRYFKVNPIILGILGISYFMIGFMVVMLNTKFFTFKTWISGTFITIYCIGIFLFLMNFTIYVGKQEKGDLEGFIKDIFSSFIID
jgi:hypothetical protein